MLAAARATIRRKKYCLLATRGLDGVDARVVLPMATDEALGVWIGTSPTSRKVAQVRACDRATLVYEDDARWACVVLLGRAEVVDHPDACQRHFLPLHWAFFPGGPTSDYVLIKFVPERIEVLDLKRKVAPDPFGLAAAVLTRQGSGWVREA
ncbi:MAG: pyridoxamine 5'-phosphate oxidase family protein [Deltaproteobacteria bacterium]|nr:pyridoxamine 5'-phosphate oxidase family protein [Deltaproteobacteria bacterium]